MDLWQALAAWYDASPSLAVAGGLHKDLDPDKPPELPYAVVVEVATVAEEYDFEGRSPSFVETTFQLSIFAASEGEARSLARAWTRGPEGLDSAELPVTDGRLLALLRSSGPSVRKDPDPAPDGSDVFIADAEWAATIQEV